MKLLCLAYGAQKDWLDLTKQEQEQEKLLAQDQVFRDRGNLMSALESRVTTVISWDGTPAVITGSFVKSNIPSPVFRL